MKWFWKINYLITIYFIVILPIVFLDGSFGLPNFRKNDSIHSLINLISINGLSLFLSLGIEWLQFPLCLIAIIFWKEERTKSHFFYMFLLIVLNLVKWISWFFATGSTIRS